MSKFLLNLLVQISKVYQKSKFQIKFERILFLELCLALVFGPAADTSLPPQPARSPPPHWASASWLAQPTLPLLSLSHGPRLAFFFLRTNPIERSRPLAPHRVGHHRLLLPKWPEHSPLITSHHPASPLPKQLIMELHYATASPSMAGRLRSSPRPYKRRPSTLPPSHHPSDLPLSFPPLLSSTAVAEPDAAGETPLHSLPTHGDPAVELAGPSFPSPASWPELLGTGAVGGRAPVSSRARQWPPVHGGPVAPWTESTDFSVQK
jgi:hypothetical protein